MLGEFGPFGDCSASCGEGMQSRMQECIINEENCNPTPTSGSCGEVPVDMQPCIGVAGCGKFQAYVSNSIVSWLGGVSGIL